MGYDMHDGDSINDHSILQIVQVSMLRHESPWANIVKVPLNAYLNTTGQ